MISWFILISNDGGLCFLFCFVFQLKFGFLFSALLLRFGVDLNHSVSVYQVIVCCFNGFTCKKGNLIF